MLIKLFLRGALCLCAAGPVALSGQEEEDEVAFREALYLSEVNRDLRAPQATRVGGVVFVSAMTAPGASFEQQLKAAYIRVQSTLGNYGLTMESVAQERIYLLDGADAESARRIRVAYYKEDSAPASTLVMVAGLEQEGARVAIEVVAVADPYEE